MCDLSCHLPSVGLSFLRVKSGPDSVVSKVLKAMKVNYYLPLSPFNQCFGGPLAGTEVDRRRRGYEWAPASAHASRPCALKFSAEAVTVFSGFLAPWTVCGLARGVSGFTVLCFQVQGTC